MCGSVLCRTVEASKEWIDLYDRSFYQIIMIQETEWNLASNASIC